MTTPFALDAGGSLPQYVQIARAIAADIRRGRFRPGAALPGTRALALTLQVHRNTVLAAYAELLAEGWVVAQPGRGTFVSSSLPEPRPGMKPLASDRSTPIVAEPAFALRTHPSSEVALTRPGAELALLGGSPDLRLVPAELLARAYRRALRAKGAGLLGYGPAEGEPRLRQELAALVASRRAVAARAENVLVTRGSQMALDLVARVLCAPGDSIAVEALGYKPAWQAFKAAGARLVPIAVDRHGLVVEELARAARRQPIRAVYVTPHHQYPSTAVLSPARRMELLALAARERFAVIEDDYDHEFHYDGRPVLPLASADSGGSVIYLGTLAKVLAPGLRLGFVVAPARLVGELARRRFFVDRQGDHAMEAAIAELLGDGEIERHVRKMRGVYRARRDALVGALERHLRGRFEPEVPAGGMALWGRVPAETDIEGWQERALERGVLFLTARAFTFDGRSLPHARLGFAALSESELEEAVRRLAAAWPSSKRRPPAKARA